MHATQTRMTDIARSEEVVKACTDADRLQKKLKARGYCAYGKTGIGRTGKPWTQKERTQAGFLTKFTRRVRGIVTLSTIHQFLLTFISI